MVAITGVAVTILMVVVAIPPEPCGLVIVGCVVSGFFSGAGSAYKMFIVAVPREDKILEPDPSLART